MSSPAATKHFLEDSHFNGLAFIANARNNNMRIFWITVFISCVIGLAVECCRSIVEFALAPPEAVYTIEPQSQLQLPDVVICIASRFDQIRVNGVSVSRNLTDVLQYGFVNSLLFTQPEMIGEGGGRFSNQTVEEYENFLTQHNLTYMDLIDTLAFNSSDVIDRCVINGFQKPECGLAARRLWLWPGLCFEIRSPLQYVATPWQGIVVRLTVPIDRHYPGPGLRNDAGASLLLSHSGHVEAMTTLLPYDSNVHVSLELTRRESLRSSANPCQTHSQKPAHACAYDCAKTLVFENCPCIFIDDYQVGSNDSICSPIEVAACVSQANIKWEEMQQMISKCSKEACKPSCITYDYRRTFSYREADHSVKRSRGTTAWTRNSIDVDLHFEAIQVLGITQLHPMSPAELLGIIGGLLGLWLGGSIIAVVHLLAFWLGKASKGNVSGKQDAEPEPSRRKVIIHDGPREVILY